VAIGFLHKISLKHRHFHIDHATFVKNRKLENVVYSKNDENVCICMNYKSHEQAYQIQLEFRFIRDC